MYQNHEDGGTFVVRNNVSGHLRSIKSHNICISVTRADQILLVREILAVCCDSHMVHTGRVCVQMFGVLVVASGVCKGNTKGRAEIALLSSFRKSLINPSADGATYFLEVPRHADYCAVNSTVRSPLSLRCGRITKRSPPNPPMQIPVC